MIVGDISEQKLYDDMTVYLRHYYNMAPFLNRSAVRLATPLDRAQGTDVLPSAVKPVLKDFSRQCVAVNVK